MEARLARVNRTVVFLVAAAYVFAALLIPGIVGAAMLALLGGGLCRAHGADLAGPLAPHPGRPAGSSWASMIVVAVVKATR